VEFVLSHDDDDDDDDDDDTENLYNRGPGHNAMWGVHYLSTVPYFHILFSDELKDMNGIQRVKVICM
jgi:hypothetical protein